MNTRAFHISPAQCTGGERGKHSMAARFSANVNRMAFIVIFNGLPEYLNWSRET